MKRVALRFLCGVLCVACGDGGAGTGGAQTSSGAAGSPSGAGGASVSVEQALIEAGFEVRAGRFEFYDLEDCCAPGGFCSGTNPSSPYARYFLPRGPGQSAPNPNEDASGRSAAARLRPDEAVLLVGTTPPRARYFGFTTYLMDRYDSQAASRVPLFASLADTANQLTLEVGPGPDGPFDASFAMITTADAATDAEVRGALERAGIMVAHTEVLPASVVRLGLDEGADTIGALLRVAVPDSPELLEAYIANPPVAVLRVTPAAERSLVPLPEPAPRQHGSGTGEQALSPALDRLEDAIRGRIATEYPGATVEPIPVLAAPATFQGPTCIEELKFCGGDNRDALYMGTGQLNTFELDHNDVIVVFGVDHRASGKASYANFAIQHVDKAMGVTGADDGSFPGTALPYLGASDPDAGKLYVFEAARSCSGELACVEVPTAGCPFLPLDEPANLVFRAYLEPGTQTGPSAAELLVDRALLVHVP